MRWLALAAMIVATVSAADDWPQWMGQGRDGVWHETGLIDSFPNDKPDIAWSIDCGLGYSGPAVADGNVYLFDYVVSKGKMFNNPGKRATLNGKERLRCLDAATGEEKWATDYSCPYSVSYPSGPRCTPTVSGDHVFTLGAMGHLTCFARGNGEKKWQVNIPEKFGAEIPIWGFASHPLVHQPEGNAELLYTMIGGKGQALGAFDAATGELAWKSKSQSSKDAGYCPPVLYNVGSERLLIGFSPAAVFAVNPISGNEFWSVGIEPDYGMSVNAPLKADDRLIVTAYGKSLGLTMIADRPAVKENWRTPGPRSLYTCNSTPFIDKGIAYGCDINSGLVRAISIDDGSLIWETKEPVAPKGHDKRWRVRHATAFFTKIAAEDRFVLFNDLGELVFCTLDRDGYHESGRAKVVEPTGEAFGRQVVWSYPAYADKAAFVRNDKQLVRVNLAK